MKTHWHDYFRAFLIVWAAGAAIFYLVPSFVSWSWLGWEVMRVGIVAGFIAAFVALR